MTSVQLLRAFPAFRAWGRPAPDEARPPAPWALVVHMVLHLVVDVAKHFLAQRAVDAQAMLLQLDAYCCPGEVLAILRLDVVPPDTTGAFGPC